MAITALIMQIWMHIWSVYRFKQLYSAMLDVKVAKVDLDWCIAKSTPTTRGGSNGAACSLVSVRHGSALRNTRCLNCIGLHRNKLHSVCFRAMLSWAKFPCIALLLIAHPASRGTPLGNTERDRNKERETWKKEEILWWKNRKQDVQQCWARFYPP